MRRIPAAVLASLALAGCTETPTSAPPIAVSSVVPSIAAVTDCGTFNLWQGERLPGSAATCFVEAVRAGMPARLKVTALTTEGKPVPVTYTAGADGRVEVVTDSRQDAFGGKIITRRTCTGPRAGQVHPAFAKCSEPTPVQSVTQ